MKKWISQRCGTRRGCILTLWYRMWYLLGRYQAYRQVDWSLVKRLVFICKGNICRSPYAEAVAQSLGVESISCGIDTTDGGLANENAIRSAAKKGIGLNRHRTTSIDSLIFRENDLLIAMEPEQAIYLKRKFGDDYMSTLLGLWGVSVNPYTHDPFGASNAYFDTCFNRIAQCVHEIARKISKASRD